MNQGRIWCVVHPTVGLPLLLGSVALTSLAVHASIMTHTTWFSNYWQGSHGPRVADNTTGRAVLQNGTALSLTVTPVPGSGAAPASFVITVAPAAAAHPTDAAVTLPPATHAPVKTASAG